MSTITRERAQKIIEAADEVITALAGTNENVHPEDSRKMCDLWDDLNDRYAPPEVVRELARIALASQGAKKIILYRERNPYNGLTTGWEELTEQEYEIVKDNASKHAEFRTVYTAPPVPVVPAELHPDTQKLVIDFCTALAEKLYKAQLKYGYDADWKQDGWPTQCQAHFHQHIAKGDPRDVAAYCAFMWYHGWKTESEPAPVSVPDDVMAAIQKVARIRLDLNYFDGDRRGIAESLGEAEEALVEVVNLRAAMLQGKESERV